MKEQLDFQGASEPPTHFPTESKHYRINHLQCLHNVSFQYKDRISDAENTSLK